jgi:hypothetical protein
VTRDEADSLLRAAIEQHAEAFGLHRDGEMLSSYGVIAHWQVEIDDGHSRYTTHFHTPTVPMHIATGLFAAGQRLVGEDE